MESTSSSSGSAIGISNLTKMIKAHIDQGESDQAHDLLLEFESKYVEGLELRNDALIKLLDTQDECSKKINEISCLKDRQLEKLIEVIKELSESEIEKKKSDNKAIEDIDCLNVRLQEMESEIDRLNRVRLLDVQALENLRCEAELEKEKFTETVMDMDIRLWDADIFISEEIEKRECQILELKRQLSESETEKKKLENKAIEDIDSLNVRLREMESEIGRLNGGKLLDAQALENLKSEAAMEKEKLTDTVKDKEIRLSAAEIFISEENQILLKDLERINKIKQEKLKDIETCYEKFRQENKNLPRPPYLAKVDTNTQSYHHTPNTLTNDIIVVSDGEEDEKTCETFPHFSQKVLPCVSSLKRKQIAPGEEENHDNKEQHYKRQNKEFKRNPLPFIRRNENVVISSVSQLQSGNLSIAGSTNSDDESCSSSCINDLLTHIQKLQENGYVS